MFGNLARIWSPEIYQGRSRMKGYFEGWYYKLVDSSEAHVHAIIPGVSFERDGTSHCFVQWLNGKDASSQYFRYDLSEFRYSENKFEIWIGGSYFGKDKIELDIKDPKHDIRGNVHLGKLKPWPVTLLSPGAMGWYAFVPFMECYHGVISFDHSIAGELSMGGNTVNFNGGKGYIEKDWGRSFPHYYIWSQSNHFDRPGTSIMLSIANIPWIGRSFDGFMVGLVIENRFYKFTTYSGARISALRVEKDSFMVHIDSGEYSLQVEAHKSKDAALAAPALGSMERRIHESMTSEIWMKLDRRHNGSRETIFEGRGRHAGFEMSGDVSKLVV